MSSTRLKPMSHHLFPYFHSFSFVNIFIICSVLNVFIVYNTFFTNAYLIFANRKDIRKLDEKFVYQKRAYNDTIVQDGLEDAAAIDFDYEEKIIFWTDAGLESIRGLRLNISHSFEIISSGIISPDGLACDWITKKIYWADSETNRIEVCHYDGSLRRVLFWTDIDQPRAIILVPSDGLMFWSDWGETPKIERASMDGKKSTRKIIIGDKIYWPNGLAVDYDAKRLYWADSKLSYISSSDFDGKNRRVIISNSTSLITLYALTLFGDHLFWTDWKNPNVRGIYICNKNTGKLENVYAHSNLEPMGITVFDASRQAKSPNPCAGNNGGCSHLCLLSSSSERFSCACPTGVVLMDDQKTCRSSAEKVLLLARRVDMRRISLDTKDYTAVVVPIKGKQQFFALDYDPVEKKVYWTNDELHLIKRASLDGNDQEKVIDFIIDRPDGIAVDWVARNLYWTDSGTDRIEVSRLDGSSRRTLFTTNMDQPRAIVVHPEAGLMFWSDWGKHPKIERASLDGSNRTIIIDTMIEWPNGLAIDYELSTIYWCDAKTDLIEMAYFDGSNRRVIANLSEHSPHLFGFTLLDEWIYWSDWQRRSVERIHKLSGENFEAIVEQLPDLMGLKAVALNKVTGKNLCSENNGNCSHLCFNRPHNDFVCGCPNGYKLTDDHRSCEKLKAHLLMLSSNEILKASFATNSKSKILFSGLQNAVSMSLDTTENQIYYIDSQQKSIFRIYLDQFTNGMNIEPVIQYGLVKPECVAIDWISKNIYWTDSELGRIEVARQNGSFRRILFDDNNRKPYSLAISPNDGFFFWSDYSRSTRIERLSLDGVKRKLIIDNVGRAASLTIDSKSGRLFWINLDTLQISSITLDGRENSIVLMQSDLRPRSLTFYNNSIYFFDSHSNKFQIINNVDGNDIHEFSMDNQQASIIDLAVYDQFSQQGWNPCAVANGGCDHLCFPRINYRNHQSGFHCSCATHYNLSDDRTCLPPESFLLFSQKTSFNWFLFDRSQTKHHFQDVMLPIHNIKNIRAMTYDSFEHSFYWIDSKSHAIKRVPINGTNVELIINNPNAIQPLDLIIDPYARLLFWTCGKTRSINATRLIGSRTMLGSVYHSRYDRPHLLAYHFRSNTLFWTNDLNNPQIEKISLMTSVKVTVLSEKFTKILAIAIDQELDLLIWADAYRKRLEYSNLNGQYRHELYKDSEVSPIALTAHSKYLFWIEKDAKTIEKLPLDLNAGNQKQTIFSRLTQLTDIISVERMDKNLSSLFCTEDNGGCSHMCFLNHTDHTPRCACPNYLILSIDSKKCVEPTECSDNKFRCMTGQCIDLIWRCNGTPDCPDNSDELNCPKCLSNQFVCYTGKNEMNCLENRLICDGVKHCLDGFDEMCCGSNEFRCSVSRSCLSISQLCDKKNNCPGGEDEEPQHCERTFSQSSPSKLWHEPVLYIFFFIVFIAILILIFVCFTCVNNSKKEIPSIDMRVIDRQSTVTYSNGHLNNALRLDNCNTMTTTVSEMLPTDGRHGLESTVPLLTNAAFIGHPINRSTGANGVESLIDRNITGASSASCSSANNNYPHQTTNPPPSPVASSHSSSLFVTRPSASRNKTGGKNGNKPPNRRHKKSRWAANLNRGPPPTPCHTDTYEDIEPSNIKYLVYNNIEMDDYGYRPAEAPPSSFYPSYFPEPSYPPSPSTERSFPNPFPPPPSPVQEYD